MNQFSADRDRWKAERDELKAKLQDAESGMHAAYLKGKEDGRDELRGKLEAALKVVRQLQAHLNICVCGESFAYGCKADCPVRKVLEG